MNPVDLIKAIRDLFDLSKETLIGLVAGLALAVSLTLIVWRKCRNPVLIRIIEERDKHVASLEKQIVSLEQQMKANDSQIEELDDDLEAAQEKIRELDADLEAALKRIRELIGGDGPRPPLPPSVLALVSSRQELEDNIRTFAGYIRGDNTEQSFAKEKLKQGNCFVFFRDGDRQYFGPSKFVGYANDSRETYKANIAMHKLHGQKSNIAITNVLKQNCQPNEELNKIFQSYCKKSDLDVSLERDRKFWRIDK